MKSLKVFFTLIVVIMFVMTSCSKEENPVTDLQAGSTVLYDTVAESEMIPASEFYENYEENLEELIEELQNMDEITEVANRACEEISSVLVSAADPNVPCDVELLTQTTRDVGQIIRIVHFARGINGIQSDEIYDATVGNCISEGLTFSIPYGTLTSGAMNTCVLITDANGTILLRKFTQWSNC